MLSLSWRKNNTSFRDFDPQAIYFSKWSRVQMKTGDTRHYFVPCHDLLRARSDGDGRRGLQLRAQRKLAPQVKILQHSFRLIVIVVATVFSWQRAKAQAPLSASQRIIHASWTFKDGAPEQSRAFAQTADGYLWVGAPAGLFRFDGVRFELFRSPFGDQLQSTNVSALFAPASGGLWIGYVFGGFSFLSNGRITNFVESTRSVFSFAEDENGNMWAAASRGLWRFDRAA